MYFFVISIIISILYIFIIEMYLACNTILVLGVQLSDWACDLLQNVYHNKFS